MMISAIQSELGFKARVEKRKKASGIIVVGTMRRKYRRRTDMKLAGIILIGFACGIGAPATADGQPEFDAASIKPAPPPTGRGNDLGSAAVGEQRPRASTVQQL